MRKVAALIDGVVVFSEVRWFIQQRECVEFSENHIMKGKLQWFIIIVSYLQFVTGENL